MGTAIRVEGLSKKYPSGDLDLVVLHNFSLDVDTGERLAITGESGSGKSTLLHLLGGVDRPSGGKIYYGSRDIFSFSDAELAKFRNREIGFVWQVQSLLPEFTALENVSMPLRIRGEETSEATRLALASLEEVGLGKRATHRAGELSGGEQQRVALARALAGKPQVLLADEPTGNLDPRTGEMIIGLLDELHRTHGFTSVVVTHNVSFARRCDRIIELGAGAGSELRAETYGRDYV